MSNDGARRDSGALVQSAGEYFVLALWFGVLTGLAEVVLLIVQHFGMGRFVFLSRDALWMAPLANTMFAVLTAALLFLVATVRRKRLSLQTVASVLGAVGFTAVLFMYPKLHRGAEMALAVGLAVAAGRLIGRFPSSFRRLVWRTAPVLAGLVLLAGLGLHGWLALEERRALARVPQASGRAPNVLLIILDTVRSMDLSLYGYARKTTPHLERLAREATTFNRAFSPSPWTLPAHASIFTGRWPYELTADWGTPLDATYPTLAEELGKRGYVTGAVTANLLFCTWETGLSRGFVHWDDAPINLQQVLKASSIVRVLTVEPWFRRLTGIRQRLARTTAADINGRFLGWLDQAPDKPFFAFLNYLDAHAPYLPTAPYDTVFPPVLPLQNAQADEPGTWTPEGVRAARDAYDRSLAYLDDQVGRLIEELRRRGVLDSTLVIITSDHGEEFYEHQVMSHGNSLYRPAVQIPLMIRYPGKVPAGRRIDIPVSSRAISATIMDLLDAADSPFPGRSLAASWQAVPGDSATYPDTVLSVLSFAQGLPARFPASRGDMSSIMAEDHRLIRNGDGRLELYDAVGDSLELVDLADSSSSLPVKERLSNALKSELGRLWDHRKPARGRQ